MGRTPLAVVLACVLMMVCAPLAHADVFGSLAPAEPGTSGQYLVKFAAGTSEADQAAALADAGAQDLSYVAPLRMHSVLLPADNAQAAVEQLDANPAVARVEAEASREASSVPSDPEYGTQWALPRIGWDQVYGAAVLSGSATVAVLDTGVNASHADLAGNVVPGVSVLEPGHNGTNDPNGHGTAMAGVVAASTDNGEGVAGVGYAGVNVMPVTVLDAGGVGQDGDIINGVVWAADHGADVILMAFSSPDYSASLQEAIDYAWSKGAVLVAATGNDSSSAAHYPAGDRGVVGVGNTDATDALNASSNFGLALFMAAPGTGVRTTDAVGGYSEVTGTSASAAMVAGAAALVKAWSPDATNGVVVGRLARSADATPNGDTGNGRLNLVRAMNDTSIEEVRPEGTTPVGSGGPFIGPYVIAETSALDGWRKTSSSWSNVNNPQVYSEGATVPIRTRLTGLNPGKTYTVALRYDFRKAPPDNTHFIDFLTSVNHDGIPNVDPCIGITPCASPTSIPIPTDPEVAAFQASGSMSAYNVSSATLNPAYTIVPAGSDLKKQIILTFVPTNSTVVLAYGGHLARDNEWGTTLGVSNGASEYSGGSGKAYAQIMTCTPLTPGPCGTSSEGNVGINPTLDGGTASGIKFHDRDANTTRDADGVDNISGNADDENPLAGWTIRAYVDTNANGTLELGETTIAASGQGTATTTSAGYNLISLSPGTYVVCERIDDQTGWFQSAPANTKCGALPVSAGVAAGGHAITVAQSTEADNQDFGNYRKGTISGIKFNDVNGDGTRQPATEGLLSGWTIRAYLDNGAGAGGIAGDGILQAGETSFGPAAVTNASGAYTLTLDPGKYVVCEVLTGHSNFTQSKPSTPPSRCGSLPAGQGVAPGGYPETVTSGSSVTTDDFGNFQSGSLSGIKYEDADASGAKNGSETGPSVSFDVAIYRDNGATAGQLDGTDTLVDTVQTGAGTGAWSKSGLAAGSYIVCEVQQSGWTQSQPSPTASPVCGPAVTGSASGGGYAVTVTTGNNTNVGNLGNYRNASVSGTKYEDRNANGAQDVGETGPAESFDVKIFRDDGTTPNQRDNSDTLVDTVPTAVGTGAWSKSGLKPDRYIVCEVQKTGWTQSQPNPTSSPVCGAVSTGNPTGGGHVVTLTSGQSSTAKDFGNYRNATIDVTKYEDLNANGTRDDGEPALEDWHFFIDENGDDTYQSGEPQATTDSTGKASFSVKPGSNRRVCETLQTSWHNSEPGDDDHPCYTVLAADLESGETASSDFGNYRNATVEVTKYEDLNANGTRDDGEPALEDWHFFIDENSDDEFQDGEPEATTDSTGKASFSVKPGSDRRVCESLQAGWHNSDPGSDANPCKTIPADELESGETAERDFGNFKNATVEVTKYEDLNADGDRDDGEPALEGWDFFLDENGNGELDEPDESPVATDGDGKASFSVTPGSDRRVCEVLKDGWHNSEPGNDDEPCKTVLAADLESGETASSDFGNFKNATVEVTKYEDLNADGDRDDGEPALEGWDFFLDENGNGELDEPDESPVATDGDGKASFSVTPGSDRRVCEVLKDGWHNSEPGNDDEPCKTVLAADLESGETASSDFGNFKNATVEVTKYEDLNANGDRDEGEPALEGWDFFLDKNGNGELDEPDESAVATDGDGKASFSVTPGSDRRVCEVGQTDWHNSEPGGAAACYTVNASDLESGEKAELDFGNYQDATVEVTKYEDLNANGDRDEGEPALEGWDFFLDENGNGELDEPDESAVATDSNGKASFTVTPGSDQRVCEVLQGGWHNSEPGNDDEPCTTVDKADLESGETAELDFGNYQDATVEVTKYEDLNANGDRDEGEPALEGWQFFLDENGNGELDEPDESAVATDSNGKASFTVTPGSDQRVCEVLQGGWHNSEPGNDDEPCTTVDKADLESGEKAELDFGNYQDATIEVTKYEDLNANGDRDEGEPALEGWKFFIDENGNGQLDEPDETAVTTGTDGKASFTVAPGADRRVCEVLQGGWHNSEPGNDDEPCTTVDKADLESGEKAELDFGNYQDATIEVTKYDDLNANGDRDDGEPALEGWKFFIDKNGNGQLDEPDETAVTTGTDGKASFTVAPGADRRVCEVLQGGWHNSEPGNDDEPCTTVDKADLESGEKAELDFGNYQDATIEVTKYDDLNADGDRDDDEPALSGWHFFLDANGNGALDEPDESAVATDGDGKASFTVTPGADRRVCEVLQGGWHNSEPGNDDEPCSTVDAADLDSGQTAKLDFGNYQNASVSGVKYEDMNANGDQDADEGGPTESFNIQIFRDNGTDSGKLDDGDTPVDTVPTDAGTGAWSKSGLEPDSYVICEVQKASWKQSEPDPASDPVCGPASAGDPSGGGYAVTLISGEDREDVDFGNYRDATIEVTKYDDLNANGDRDDGEPALEGWDFFLDKNGNGQLDQPDETAVATGTDGKASFTVTPGSDRRVCEVLQDGWHNSEPGNDDEPCRTVDATDLESGEKAERDFGNYQNATIEVTKYEDLNANGDRDEGEPALEGWEFKVGDQTESTGPDGKATFSVKPGSDRTVCETLQDGWHNSEPGTDANPCATIVAADLESGETAKQDFGNYENATLKGQKFEDKDASGTKDAGDGGLNGWTIKAYKDADGDGLDAADLAPGAAAVATTATVDGTAGSYSLSVKPGAKYVVCEQLLSSDWKQSKPGNENCKAGAPTLADGGHATDTLSSGDAVPDLDFGNYMNATVEVLKYEDKNANGSQDTGEGPLEGWEFKVGSDTKTTGTNGKASFSVKPGSSRTACETLQDGWHNSDPGSNASPCKTVDATDLESGETASRKFGNYRNATVEVTKYNDLNADGDRDDGEPPLKDWEFKVGSDTKLTGDDGKATFSVKPGSDRTVCETLQTGWHNSDPGNDASPCKAVDASELESGETAKRNFGNYQNATLKGVKFEDNNTNGTQQQPGENGLNDWTIEAYEDTDGNGSLTATEYGDGAAATAMTQTVGGVAGSYSLSVKPGAKYVVCEVAKAGWLQSAPGNDNCKAGSATLANGGHASGALTSGQTVGDLNFGNYQRGTVSGTKFEDKDSNGSQGTGEGGLGGWMIKAYRDSDGNGSLSAAEVTAGAAAEMATNEDGSYSLSLTPDTYIICEVAQTNWVQTKPNDNTKCKYTGSPFALGGYLVPVTPGSSTPARDFGNRGFDSTSTLTDSAFRLVDDLTPWTIADFEILMNPKNQIVATNPGQFYYHQRATNTSGSQGSMQFDIDWPCQFQTQTTGGQPIHAYVQLAGDPVNTWRDWTPNSSGIWWTTGNACAQSPDGKITVNDLPAGATAWVTVHLDYALKGTPQTAGFGNPPILYAPFQSTATMAGGASFSSGQLVGRGKKVTVVYGRMTNKTGGAAMYGVWVRLVQGTKTAVTMTDMDGNYVFFDTQQCDDGLVRCTGVSNGVWNFAAGNNVSSRLEILGNAANPYPDLDDPPTLPDASPTWLVNPNKTNLTVFSGNQTFANLTAPTSPVYSPFNISKNSAYNRDWKFGP